MQKVKAALSVLSALALLHSCFQPLLAQSTHVVSAAELHDSVLKQSAKRQESMATLDQLFSRPEVGGALEKTVGSPQKIMQAVAVLDDAELARLAARAQDVNQEFAAGALTNQELTYIVIALGTAVLILVIVAAGD